MNYRSCYEGGAEILRNAQIPEPELDARLLLEFVCRTNRNDLLAHGEREVLPQNYERYMELLEKRVKRIPLQHILGTQEFMGLCFKVDEHVLAPRQDTEVLVERAIKSLKPGMRILDMCTGSGCILISLLHDKPTCEGIGVDISKDALAIAKENGNTLLSKNDNVQWLESDLFTAVMGKYDLIISNPPYIRTAVIEELMPEVKTYEPRIALDGKEDGLYFYKRIIDEAASFLNPGGELLFEIGYDQARDVSEYMQSHRFTQIEVIQDYAGLDRVVCGQMREF